MIIREFGIGEQQGKIIRIRETECIVYLTHSRPSGKSNLAIPMQILNGEAIQKYKIYIESNIINLFKDFNYFQQREYNKMRRMQEQYQQYYAGVEHGDNMMSKHHKK
jgi:hypothetical protein